MYDCNHGEDVDDNLKSSLSLKLFYHSTDRCLLFLFLFSKILLALPPPLSRICFAMLSKVYFSFAAKKKTKMTNHKKNAKKRKPTKNTYNMAKNRKTKQQTKEAEEEEEEEGEGED